MFKAFRILALVLILALWAVPALALAQNPDGDTEPLVVATEAVPYSEASTESAAPQSVQIVLPQQDTEWELLAMVAALVVLLLGTMFVQYKYGESLKASYPPEAQTLIKAFTDSLLKIVEQKVKLTPNTLDDAVLSTIKNIVPADRKNE